MALSKQQQKGMMLAAGGALAVTIALFAATAKADDRNGKKNGNGNGKKNGKYDDPDPNRPNGNGKKEATEPSYERPADLQADQLWISPECDDAVEGEDWMEAKGLPAIRAWVVDGFGMPGSFRTGDSPEEYARLGQERVVREILGPYAPLCIDTWPWLDVYILQSPPPDPVDYGGEWTPEGTVQWPSEQDADTYQAEWDAWSDGFDARFAAANEQYPLLGEIIRKVAIATRDEWLAQNGGQP